MPASSTVPESARATDIPDGGPLRAPHHQLVSTGSVRRRADAKRSDPGEEALALRRLTLAAVAERAVTEQASAHERELSRHELQVAVDAARMIGVGWTKIGGTLGIRSGNAYQKYRKPATTRFTCDAAFTCDGRG
jgi:hypothetical protein